MALLATHQGHLTTVILRHKDRPSVGSALLPTLHGHFAMAILDLQTVAGEGSDVGGRVSAIYLVLLGHLLFAVDDCQTQAQALSEGGGPLS